eukprot:8648720-Alexandrium_andersonii.AAC.1
MVRSSCSSVGAARMMSGVDRPEDGPGRNLLGGLQVSTGTSAVTVWEGRAVVPVPVRASTADPEGMSSGAACAQ